MPPKKANKRQARKAAAQKGAATRSKNAALKKAEASQADDASSPASSPAPVPPTTPTVKDIKPNFPDFLDLGGDPNTLTPVPSLTEFPEILTSEVKTNLLTTQKASTRCIDYNLPMNYGYLPLHEVVNEKEEPFTQEWWDTSKPGLLSIADLDTREPTAQEVKENSRWIGKRYKQVTLYYSLSADKMGNQTLGEILAVSKVKHIYQHMTCLAMKFFGPLCRAKAAKFWEHPVTQANATQQMVDLVTGFAVPRERHILELVINDPEQPVCLIRNGDLGKEPRNSINLNTTANMAVLKYLAHCPTGIHPDDAGTKRYKCESPGPDRPYGFSFDDLFRGVVAYHACVRQREKSSHVHAKKGVIDGAKTPSMGERAIGSYIKASQKHYGQYIAEDDPEDAIPENLAQQGVMNLAEKIISIHKQYEERMAKEGRSTGLSSATIDDLASRLWRRTAYMFRVAQYNSITQAAAGKGSNSSSRRKALDPMEQLPPIDHKTVLALISELYSRGFFKQPVVTTSRGIDIMNKFRALLPDTWCIEAYMAQLERDGDVTNLAIEEGAQPVDGQSPDEQHRENLKQCHAMLALIPPRLPIEMSFTDALEKLGMFRPEAEGDEKYTDLRIDRRDTPDGQPLNPDGYSLKPGQVVDVVVEHEMKQSPLRGVLLANEVGTGKTIVFAMACKFSLDHRLAMIADEGLTERDETDLPPVMPTLILAPASVIEQHFNEISNYFPDGTFHIRVYHGSVNNTSHNPALQKAVMTTEQLIAEMDIAVRQKKTSQNARKLWLWSYSTASHRLLKKEPAVTFTRPKERPYRFGPWEFDVHNGLLPLDPQRMELIRKATANSYLSASAAGKQAVESAFPLPAPGNDDKDEPVDDDDDGQVEFIFDSKEYKIHNQTARAHHVSGPEQQQLIEQYVLDGGSTTYTNDSGKEVQKVAKFLSKFNLLDFPKGFYFQHIVADECQFVRNPLTGFSRLLRLLIKMSYRNRPDKEQNPSSLVLVSATPAINQVTDYRGLSSLF
ncbi:hypothetical protein KVR01_008717 [Diaporthe batatas]|uniref:uncharacterized protein n=1 Tax=Diaporthe batatas TaxID=748121 RepID=UPI001D052E5C|nr:uncharacterized protein KVR01_008717 [Diaporthe batatas]KAG8161730.1 hypothetical protein KVR01_008717 [Diaporthe batatas]